MARISRAIFLSDQQNSLARNRATID